MRRGYNKTLTVVLIIILIAVIGLIAYLGYDYYSQYRIKKDNAEAVDAFMEEVAVEDPLGDKNTSNSGNIVNELNTTEKNTTTNTATENEITEITNTTTDSTNNSNNSSSTKTGTKAVKKYKGFVMLGTIEIPKTKLKSPVLEKVTKKSLDTAVAVQYPFKDPVLNAIGNVVISGHNYRNGLFFSNNKKLSNGDKIYITDTEGKKVTYTIYKIFETDEQNTEFYFRDTKGKREITLSTCTDDAKARLIIQARE